MHVKYFALYCSYIFLATCKLHRECGTYYRENHFLTCMIVSFSMYCRLQEARLEVLKQILEQREEEHADLNTKRLDRLWLGNVANIVCVEQQD